MNIKNKLLLSLFLTGGGISNTNCDYEVVAKAYAGWYFGIGVSHQYTKGEVQLDDNIISSGIFGDRFADAHALSLIKSNIGNIGAVLTAGYGNIFIGDYYIGAEICFDIAGSKSRTNYNYPYWNTTLKTRGIIPTIALKLGKFIPAIDCLAYMRFGFTSFNNKFENDVFVGQGFGSQKITPVIGLGVEQMIYDNCSLKIEGDYRFPANSKKSDLMGYSRAGNAFGAPYSASINNKVRGYAVRVMCVYHF
ncbi:MAG: hypothetical protein IJT36_02510 [Alphaproteobacteria bacterium]|nr:hypothetical protein [Alphaproteobacteria bacterium]